MLWTAAVCTAEKAYYAPQNATAYDGLASVARSGAPASGKPPRAASSSAKAKRSRAVDVDYTEDADDADDAAAEPQRAGGKKIFNLQSFRGGLLKSAQLALGPRAPGAVAALARMSAACSAAAAERTFCALLAAVAGPASLAVTDDAARAVTTAPRAYQRRAGMHLHLILASCERVLAALPSRTGSAGDYERAGENRSATALRLEKEGLAAHGWAGCAIKRAQRVSCRPFVAVVRDAVFEAMNACTAWGRGAGGADGQKAQLLGAAQLCAALFQPRTARCIDIVYEMCCVFTVCFQLTLECADAWHKSEATFNHIPKPISIEDEAVFASVPRTATTSLQQFAGGHPRQARHPHMLWHSTGGNKRGKLPCCGLFHSEACQRERKKLYYAESCGIMDGCPSAMVVRLLL
jgi:hypothetical protein